MALSLRQSLRSYAEGLRYRLLPRFARALVHLTTFRPRRAIPLNAPLRILIDNTVRGLAITHESAWITTETGGYMARINVHPRDSEGRAYRNACCLPGVAHLARLGHLELLTSAELKDETFRQPMGRFTGYGYMDLNLFADIQLKSIDGHVLATMGPSWMGLPSAVEQQRHRLANTGDPLHEALVKLLGPTHSQDAWHICTAERNGLFCFLTTDFGLLNHVQHMGGKEPLRSLKTRIMSPEQLAKHLDLPPIPTVLFSYDKASFPVRADLSWLDGNRRQVSDYRKAKNQPPRRLL